MHAFVAYRNTLPVTPFAINVQNTLSSTVKAMETGAYICSIMTLMMLKTYRVQIYVTAATACSQCFHPPAPQKKEKNKGKRRVTGTLATYDFNCMCPEHIFPPPWKELLHAFVAQSYGLCL